MPNQVGNKLVHIHVHVHAHALAEMQKDVHVHVCGAYTVFPPEGNRGKLITVPRSKNP